MRRIIISGFIAMMATVCFGQSELRYSMESLKLSGNRVNFKNIKNTEVFVDTIRYKNNTDSIVSISFDRVPDYITVKAEPANAAPQEEGIIIVNLDAEKSNFFGYKRDRFYIKQGSTLNHRNVINISGTIEEDFSKLSAEELKNAPKIEFENKVFKFDTLQQGESVSFEFKFKNTGKTPLIIRSTKASCGCTATKPEKDVIEAGEESQINVTFNSRGKRGMQHKSITVVTNCPEGTTQTLKLQGFVKTN